MLGRDLPTTAKHIKVCQFLSTCKAQPFHHFQGRNEAGSIKWLTEVFLADVWTGSSPAPSPFSLASKLDRWHREDWERETTCCRDKVERIKTICSCDSLHARLLSLFWACGSLCLHQCAITGGERGGGRGADQKDLKASSNKRKIWKNIFDDTL